MPHAGADASKARRVVRRFAGRPTGFTGGAGLDVSDRGGI